MSSLTPNSFSSYAHSQEEAIQSSLLTTLQQEYIQNQIALAAEEKLALSYDPKDPQSFMQNEAYHSGQLAAYRFLLDSSAAANERLLELQNPQSYPNPSDF